MKKSFLNIISLALSVVNIALLLVLIFAIVPTMNKMNNLVGQICTAIDLELENSYGPSPNKNVNIDNLVTYDLEQATIPLALSGDQKDHYAVASITLVMDSTHEDYSSYGTEEKLAERVSLIKSTIRKVFAEYTIEQAKDPQYREEIIPQAILEALHALYQSDFIYDVRFSELLTS